MNVNTKDINTPLSPHMTSILQDACQIQYTIVIVPCLGWTQETRLTDKKGKAI